MIKLIASDMDGTLLNHDMQVTPENLAAIHEAIAKDVTFITATGRGIAHARKALDVVDLRVPMILLNGAQMMNEKRETIFTVPIPQKLAFQILDQLAAQNLYCELFTENHVYSEDQAVRIDFFVDHLLEREPQLSKKMAIVKSAEVQEQLPLDFVASIKETLLETQEEVLKIIAFDKKSSGILADITKDLEATGELAVAASDNTNIEINHVNAQKGIALAHYAEELNLSAAEVMAIGDNYNDLSMLHYAGASFAMGNAEEPVKAVAKYVTDTNANSGVAKAIRKILEPIKSGDQR